MTPKDKDLLVKDLCARLNTNLVCSIYRTDDYGVGYRDEILTGYCKGDIWYEFYFGDDCVIGIDNVSKIKPYLFPLSSMTEEQKIECFKGTPLEIDKYGGIAVKDDNLYGGSLYTDLEIYLEVIDWLIKNHFDYRGLIEKGLANNATGLNIY
jgi:hypothetical protein